MRGARVGLLALGVLLGCSRHLSQAVPAPDFTLKDLSGKEVRLSSLQGHPVLLDFWATWCGPCRLSIPSVQAFYLRHKDEGLVVLGINMDEDPTAVPEFVRSFQMTYSVLYGGMSAVADSYDVGGIPSFVFIDPQGRISERYEGFSPSMVRRWEDDLQRLLAVKPQ
jgi:thiol-disulfide isomerase/thioredoxin